MAKLVFGLRASRYQQPRSIPCHRPLCLTEAMTPGVRKRLEGQRDERRSESHAEAGQVKPTITAAGVEDPTTQQRTGSHPKAAGHGAAADDGSDHA